MSINELFQETFLEFQAKISENNLILGRNVVLWVRFHPASMVKVNRQPTNDQFETVQREIISVSLSLCLIRSYLL
jgi:hypothetical protein